MFHSMLSSLVVLGVGVGFAAAAADKSDSKDKTDKNAKEATITKMDAKAGTVTVEMQGAAKGAEKTFKLAKGIEYMDHMGKTATADHFNTGDMVMIDEHAGEITKMKKEACEATITKVDAKKKMVTVKMHDNGKEVEKSFKLAEDVEYMDSTGKMASVDVFTSGDMVLVVERDGMIAKMKKHDKTDSKKKSDGK